MSLSLVLSLICGVGLVLPCLATDSPIIGILGLPCYDRAHYCPDSVVEGGTSYIPSSYVKWLESGGARVVPIRIDDDHSSVRSLLSQLNGVLFTGGSADFDSSDPYWLQVLNILDYLRQFQRTNKKAIPLWATCLGFEAILCATAQSGVDIRCDCTALDDPIPIEFTDDAANSRIFASTMDESYSGLAYKYMATEDITHNSHTYCITPDDFEEDPYLASNFTVLGNSYDQNNLKFVTMIESLDSLGLYWYATQFHPEKPQYVIDPEAAANVPHFLDAIVANEYLAQFFVNECRLRNDNVMDDSDYEDQNIKNYDAWYAYRYTTSSSYEQVYIFAPQ